jgi:hypothetical protein
MLTEDFFIAIDSPTTQQAVTDTIDVAGWAISQSSPQDGIRDVVVYLDRLDDPACEMGRADYGGVHIHCMWWPMENAAGTIVRRPSLWGTSSHSRVCGDGC